MHALLALARDVARRIFNFALLSLSRLRHHCR
jgi:hypothetical protein